MVKRVCRDCPIPNCEAKYLVKLSNHLTDVHQLDYSKLRKWLQEAKLQPKVHCKSGDLSKAASKPQEVKHAIVYQLSTSRKGKTSVKMLRKGIKKARKRIKRCKRTAKYFQDFM